MQIDELLMTVCSIVRSIQLTVYTSLELILDLHSEIICHVFRHGRLTVGQLTVHCSKHMVLLGNDA